MLKPVLEPVLQRQRVQRTQHQSPEQVCTEDHARSPPVFSNLSNVPESTSSQNYEEQTHHVCPARHAQPLEMSKLQYGEFNLPWSCPSQEPVSLLETSPDQAREPSLFRLPSASVTQDVAAVRTQTEAHVQHVRFALPAEDSSEPSEAEHFQESSQMMSDHQTETEAVEEPPLTAAFMPATGSHVVQAATADFSAGLQGSVGSTTKTNLEPTAHTEPVTSSHEESVEEFLTSKSGEASLLNYSGILNLRDRMLASSESIQAQQRYLKELQEQLDAQREALLSRQKIQEQLLLQKQDKLKEQMQRKQEALKEFLNKQVSFINVLHGESSSR